MNNSVERDVAVVENGVAVAQVAQVAQVAVSPEVASPEVAVSPRPLREEVSHFKKVTATGSVHCGMKRDSLKWGFVEVTPEDLQSIPVVHEVCKVVNHYIALYGRELVAKNPESWDYYPRVEDLELSKVAASIGVKAKKAKKAKALTKAELGLLGTWYYDFCDCIGKQDAAALAGQRVIVSKFAMIKGLDDAIRSMVANVSSLLQVLLDTEDLHETHLARLIEIADIALAFISYGEELLKPADSEGAADLAAAL